MTRSWLLVPLDAVLCFLIISRVSYTEIDWVAYNQQVAQVLSGQRDYGLIKGGTGPLVYPAGHVYVYSLLHLISDSGRDVLTGQIVFVGLYLLTLTFTIAAYNRTGIKSWIIGLLVLSKRAHSIYLLRLFNDGVSALLLACSAYLFTRHQYMVGSIIYSLALSVKMNALLYLPGLALILVQARGVKAALRYAFVMIQIQVMLGMPFLLENPGNYISRSFEFSRQFLHRWTVNWRFIDEDIFLSKEFAMSLLLGHLTLLLLFASTRWMKPTGLPLTRIMKLGLSSTIGFLFPVDNDIETVRLSADFILTTLYTSNLIGILCARSLHYQFYAWFVFTIPYMLYKTNLPLVIQFALWIAQEWAWNVYPSTKISSGVVVTVPVIILTSIWFATSGDKGIVPRKKN